MKRKQPERAERLAFMQWVELHPYISRYLIAIEGGGSRHYLEAINIKKCGLRAGTPDYFFMFPIGEYHGLWIEFKAGKNKLTVAQQQFFETAQNIGYKCVVVWEWRKAVDVINKYLGHKI